MTHSDPPPSRKPRRFWLYAPYVGLAVLILAWSGVWLWTRAETERRLDAGAAALRAAGWQVGWSARHVHGYPFRLDLDLDDAWLVEPSGWGLRTPALKSEAYVFAATHWLFAAPAGLTIERPRGGAVAVSARLLRASVGDPDLHPPNLAFEGDALTFTPAPGAAPFWLTQARIVHVYARPGPDDQGAIFASVDGGSTPGDSPIARLAGGQPVELKLEAVISHAAALAGPDWRRAVTNWSSSGGAIEVDDLVISSHGAGLEAHAGTLSAGADGRLAGSLSASAPLVFKSGRTWVGAADIGPAPALF